MGNSPSSHPAPPPLAIQQQQQPYQPPRVYGPPPSNNGQHYGQQQYPPPPGWQQLGRFHQPPSWHHPNGPGYPPAPLLQQRQQIIPQTQAQTTTIRNPVNLKKNSIAARPIPGDPVGRLSITFSFDSTAPCRVSVFANAKDVGSRIVSSEAPLAVFTYDRGLDQKFPPMDSSPVTISGSSILAGKWSTAAPPPAASFSGGPSPQLQQMQFPLVIRIEAVAPKGTEGGGGEGGRGPPISGLSSLSLSASSSSAAAAAPPRMLEAVEVGGELPVWVQAQTTFAFVQKVQDAAGDVWTARHVIQKIWVKGTSYELQEIYGMEPGKPAGGAGGGGTASGEVVDGLTAEAVDGSECVICMSAPRDTTALPCRHHCMCRDCADALKNQTNKCPICRNVIHSLLHIKIAPPPATAGKAQAGSGPSVSGLSATGTGGTPPSLAGLAGPSAACSSAAGPSAKPPPPVAALPDSLI